MLPYYNNVMKFMCVKYVNEISNTNFVWKYIGNHVYIKKIAIFKSQEFVNTNMIHAILLPPNVIE